MKQAATIVIVFIIASIPPIFMNWFRGIDNHETRCGFLNLFKANYSGELADGVKASENGSDVRVDFTGLKRWSRVCLTAMERDQFAFADPRDNPANGTHFYRRGRWACQIPFRHDAVAVALVGPDGGTYAHQVVIRLDTELHIADVYGEGLPDGFRQCAPVQDAVARCAWITRHGQRLCWLLFPAEQARSER